MDYSRRKILQILGATSLIYACSGFINTTYANNNSTLKEIKLAMGTFVTLSIPTLSAVEFKDVSRETFQYMEEKISIFNRFDNSSVLATLNKNGVLHNAPKDLYIVLEDAKQYEKSSKGLFNCTVEPLLQDTLEYKKSLSLVQSMEDVIMNNNTISFAKKGMSITLDGIAKGYIVDTMALFLESKGIENYMINAGGDLRLKGVEAKNTPWSIGIQSPYRKNKIAEKINMTTGAMATSGMYEHSSKGENRMHLVNPFTAQEPLYILSATAKAPTAMQADALATAISFMQPSQALKYIAMYDNTACMIITKNNILYSPSWNTI